MNIHLCCLVGPSAMAELPCSVVETFTCLGMRTDQELAAKVLSCRPSKVWPTPLL